MKNLLYFSVIEFKIMINVHSCFQANNLLTKDVIKSDLFMENVHWKFLTKAEATMVDNRNFFQVKSPVKTFLSVLSKEYRIKT